MTFTIFKNWHRAFPPVFGLYWNKKVITRTVTFNRSFAYDIGPDQLDICKLFGIGYLPGIKKHSARFGCRYNLVTDKVDILAYVHDGNWVTTAINEMPITSCDFGVPYQMVLKIHDDLYEFAVSHGFRTYVPHGLKDKKLGFKLGLYFGGNRSAPHKIKIDIK